MDLEQLVVVRSQQYFSEEHSLLWLIENLEVTIVTINHIVATNNEMLAEAPHNANAKVFTLHVMRTNYDVFLGPYIQYAQAVPDTNKALEAQRDACQSVIDTINSGNMPRNIKFFLDSRWPRYMAGFQGQASYAWVLCHISEQAICPLCKETYTKVGMNMHTGSMSCVRDQQRIDVKAEGFEIVDSGTARAIMKAGIEYKVRPAGMDMWVPGWVNDAIRAYYSKEGGFAGMKLNEYLSKIKGD
jgi:hypothetical protein